MTSRGTARLRASVEARLAELFECRWVTLYPSFIEALYALQETVLSVPRSRQVIAFGDERSEQYSLLNSILGSYPVDRILRVDRAMRSPVRTDEVEPELLWWESVPYPRIAHERIESGLEIYSERPIRVTDVTLSPMTTRLVDADYCLISNMRGVVGHVNISCAAVIGVSRRADGPFAGDAVSATSLAEIDQAIPTVREREQIRIRNAANMERRLQGKGYLGAVRRPNPQRAAWIISIEPRSAIGGLLFNASRFDQPLGLDRSSLILVRQSVDSSRYMTLLLSVGLESPEIVADELDRLFVDGR